jgi:hypothetical protein
MYLAGWKGNLPVNEVHVPHRLEGNPPVDVELFKLKKRA